MLTAQATVAAVGGIAGNWALLDNFETYNAGPFPSAWWADLGGNSRIVEVDGNRMLDLRGTARLALLSLNDLKVAEGQTRTLFTRFYVRGDLTKNIRSLVGLNDRSLRFVTDATEAGGVGPSARVSNEAGDLMVGARYGVGAAVDFVPPALETNQVYRLWIDVTNAIIADGDIFSVWFQKEGEADGTQLFADYIGDPDPAGDPASAGGAPTRPDLDKVFVGNNDVNSVFFDDFYISKSGYNATVPRPFTVQPPTLSISQSGNQVEVRWTEGALETATSPCGQWFAVPGATPPSYQVTPNEVARFFRVRR